MHVTLAVIGGPHTGRTYTFAEHKTFLVGRSPDAHFSLPDDDRHFSRLHFMVEINPPLCRLMDLNSKNGTFINGARVSVADLCDGDTITGGTTSLRVHLAGRLGPDTVQMAPPDPARSVRPSLPPQPAGGSLSGPAIDDMYERWAKGDRVPAEAYLVAWPALTADIEAAVDVIYAEFCLREELGEGPAADDFVRRFPELGEPLRRQLVLHGGMQTKPPRDERPRLPKPAPPPPRPVMPKLPPPPVRVEGYAIERLVGRGSMGSVFLARRAADGREVALKVVMPAASGDKSAVARFLREADVMRQLDHPHIVRLFESGEAAGGKLWFAMEYIDGRNGLRLTRDGGPLEVGRAVRLSRQMLDGLAHAHARGFVHRDIKPENVLVCDAPDGEHLRLADFGLARTYQDSRLSGLTLSGTVGGTLAFMAPEQLTDFRGAKPAADQFSAAAALYFLLSGALMYDNARDRPNLFKQILTGTPIALGERRADLPADLLTAVGRALSRKPEERFPDVQAFRDALEPFTEQGVKAPE